MKTYSIDFTEEQLQIVVGALHEFPVKYAMPVIWTIQQQIIAQIKAQKKIEELMAKSKE